jgi:ADP-ribosylglycohydrolase
MEKKRITILGAIAGDTIGSIYEFNPTKKYDFPFLDERMEYTDDSIMTIAVADWILSDPKLSHAGLVKKMRYWGNKYRYPMGSYGETFSAWLNSEDMDPYNSWGNGSAMRVSPVGFAFDTLEETLKVAKISAEVTHNHPEGIKGAQATATAIFMARKGIIKAEIKEYISQKFRYNLNYSCDDIRDFYRFQASCQETVPQSLVAFFDSKDYEDAIRLTISLGGDADTMGAITGAVAAAYYKEVDANIINFTLGKLPEDLRRIVELFEESQL